MNSRVLTWDNHPVVKASAGDEAALQILLENYRPILQQIAFRQLRNAEDANDAVQETLLRAFRALPTFDAARCIKPWLFRICHNCCVDILRARKLLGEPIESHELTLADPRVDIADIAEGEAENRMVVDAINRLPDPYRDIIVMRHFRHMEVNEIADRLNAPEGTVKSWLFRARTLLRKDLAPMFA
jgi:RNA polymerase sigma-70 factor (ECF subfamily)